MEWLKSIRKAISCLEEHLLDAQEDYDVAREVGISAIYLQKGFHIMTGYSMAEYVRNRRLYLAALDVIRDKEKVIDLAFKYGYDTPESFSRAFARFHGISPVQLKRNPAKMHVFLPLRINITIQGGNEMDYIVEKEKALRLIGFEREFSMENSYTEIPEFWDEYREKYCDGLRQGKEPEGELETAVFHYHVGMFGVCIEDTGEEGRFRYLIAGRYTGGKVPEGMTLYELPEMEWAKFLCRGPMPEALQSVNTKIFREWLPENPDYEIAMGANIEWYGEGDIRSLDYESAIWIPVKKR